MGQTNGHISGASGPVGTRTIALIGPYLSGKTTLLEAILSRTDALPRQGSVNDKNSLGDASPESREHGMSVTLNIADSQYLGDNFTFIDCPGSIEFQHEGAMALSAVDAAIVVCEPDPKRLPALQVILKQLADRDIPYFLFINKIDNFSTPVRDIIPMLQPASDRPLVLRQVPIWENGIVTGFIDLASERAYVYREHAPSKIVEIPEGTREREQEARYMMLEQLADYDDALLEQLLSDLIPPHDKIFQDLTDDVNEGVICPVFLGSAQNANGIGRLLKALRHEAPDVARTAKRLKLENTKSSAFVFKTLHSGHGGRISFARVITGEFKDGSVVTGANGVSQRVSGVFSILGEETKKRGAAQVGDTVALGRIDDIKTGATITCSKNGIVQIAYPEAPDPVFGIGISLKDRKDEVKLNTALHKLIEEDPSLQLQQDTQTHQVALNGQGEMHLRVTLEKLKRLYGVSVIRHPRQVPYKETIRKPTEIRGRHKKQSGGHGQFGDVVIAIKPNGRGEGFSFDQTITGGAIPRQFIPSVKMGVEEYLQQGPLGFPVVDVQVTLKDGSYHSVDSSDMAFRQAGRLAMSEGMSQCDPVLLEPVMSVEITAPSEATPRVNAIISARRGQILGFDSRPGWAGWDVVEAHIPEADMGDLIVELRSATAGVGSYKAKFDHLAELSGKLADKVRELHKEQQAAE